MYMIYLQKVFFILLLAILCTSSSLDLQLNNYLALAQDQIRFLQTETILNHDNGSNGSLAQFGSNQSQNSSVAGNAATKGSNGSLAQFGSNQNQNSSVAGNAATK